MLPILLWQTITIKIKTKLDFSKKIKMYVFEFRNFGTIMFRTLVTEYGYFHLITICQDFLEAFKKAFVEGNKAMWSFSFSYFLFP